MSKKKKDYIPLLSSVFNLFASLITFFSKFIDKGS